ncbi:MAG: hypothetical protein K2J11_07910 [Oscillospiraceae bacterium]|nr:hypothetical protein [Oscillospiraceae bacterium]
MIMIYFKYTYYKESIAANLIEYAAFLCIPAGFITAILLVANGYDLGAAAVIVFGIMFFALKKLADVYYEHYLKAKIMSNASYAKYISVVYPSKNEMCMALNSEYREYSESIPFCDFNPNRTRNERIFTALKVLLAVGSAAGVLAAGIAVSG